MVNSATATQPNTATTGSKTSTGSNPSSTSTSADGAKISSDFTTFLKMLTAQMNNQDPLNPMDNSDFAVQLATFSGVEQQVKTNDLLTSLAGQMGAMSMSSLSNWVGMEARSVSAAHFDGATPITLQSNPPEGTKKAYVVAYNSIGNEMSRTEVTVTDDTIEWDGTKSNGTTLGAGNYTFNLESYSSAGNQIGDEQMATYAQITEARIDDGETVLVLDGGIEVNASDVDGLKNPYL